MIIFADKQHSHWAKGQFLEPSES